MLYYARDYHGALGAIGNALQLEPESASAYFVLSRIDAALGALDEAVVANERALAIAGDGASIGWRAHLIRLQALSGSADRARAGARAAAGRGRVEEAAACGSPNSRSFTRPWAIARVRSSCSSGPSASASPTSCGWP